MTIDNLIQGIVAGLVTGLLIWLFRSVWMKILSPIIEDLLYRGVRIEGQWSADLLHTSHKEEVTVKQWGNRVSGQFRCVEGEDQGHSYKFDGVFKNLILTATYESNNKHYTDRGTFTLKLMDNGTVFKGHTAYLGNTGGELESTEYIWKKNS